MALELWEIERGERAARMNKLSREVAAAMGDDWKPVRHEHASNGWADIKSGNLSFTMYDNGRKSEVICGNWPKGRDGRRVHGVDVKDHNSPVQFSIGCTLTKDPAAIARDIKRRLLPDYIHHYQKANDKILKENLRQDHKLSKMNGLAKIMGVNATSRTHHKDGDPVISVYGAGEISLDVDSSYNNDEFDFNIRRLNLEQAKKLAKWLPEIMNCSK